MEASKETQQKQTEVARAQRALSARRVEPRLRSPDRKSLELGHHIRVGVREDLLGELGHVDAGVALAGEVQRVGPPLRELVVPAGEGRVCRTSRALVYGERREGVRRESRDQGARGGFEAEAGVQVTVAMRVSSHGPHALPLPLGSPQ